MMALEPTKISCDTEQRIETRGYANWLEYHLKNHFNDMPDLINNQWYEKRMSWVSHLDIELGKSR